MAAFIEQLHEVIELAVDIPAYCHRRLDWVHIAFLTQQLHHVVAEYFELRLRQILALGHLGDVRVDVWEPGCFRHGWLCIRVGACVCVCVCVCPTVYVLAPSHRAPRIY